MGGYSMNRRLGEYATPVLRVISTSSGRRSAPDLIKLDLQQSIYRLSPLFNEMEGEQYVICGT